MTNRTNPILRNTLLLGLVALESPSLTGYDRLVIATFAISNRRDPKANYNLSFFHFLLCIISTAIQQRLNAIADPHRKSLVENEPATPATSVETSTSATGTAKLAKSTITITYHANNLAYPTEQPHLQ